MNKDSGAGIDVERRLDRLSWELERVEKSIGRGEAELAEVEGYLSISDGVREALEELNSKLFRQLLDLLEEKLTLALEEVLEQPIRFRADSDFKRGAASVEFWIDNQGNREHVVRGQGGSVLNVLSVGLRMFAITALDESEHRRFLVLDEQDCWLRPDLVPSLVKIVHQAGAALGFQVLMISHHDAHIFQQYADRVYELVPRGAGGVRLELIQRGARGRRRWGVVWPPSRLWGSLFATQPEEGEVGDHASASPSSSSPPAGPACQS